MSASPSKKNLLRRTRFQYGLRGMLAAVLLVSVVLGCYMLSVRRQQAAVFRISELGGFVGYDKPRTGDESIVAATLARCFGEDFVYDAVDVYLDGTKATDADLNALRGLAHLRGLGLGNTKVTDEGVRGLTQHQELQWLDLTNTKVTDRGLVALHGAKRLKGLTLVGTAVTDQGALDFGDAVPDCMIFFRCLRSVPPSDSRGNQPPDGSSEGENGTSPISAE